MDFGSVWPYMNGYKVQHNRGTTCFMKRLSQVEELLRKCQRKNEAAVTFKWVTSRSGWWRFAFLSSLAKCVHSPHGLEYSLCPLLLNEGYLKLCRHLKFALCFLSPPYSVHPSRPICDALLMCEAAQTELANCGGYMTCWAELCAEVLTLTGSSDDTGALEVSQVLQRAVAT